MILGSMESGGIFLWSNRKCFKSFWDCEWIYSQSRTGHFNFAEETETKVGEELGADTSAKFFMPAASSKSLSLVSCTAVWARGSWAFAGGECDDSLGSGGGEQVGTNIVLQPGRSRVTSSRERAILATKATSPKFNPDARTERYRLN